MRLSRLLAAALFVALGSAARGDDTEDFLKSDNWEGLKEYWKIDPQAKTVTAVAAKDPGFNTFFVSKKRYGDFEMTFKVELKDGKGNSGVQIRSQLLDGEKEKGKFVVAGPQADVGAQYWGSLYGERFDKAGKVGGGHMMKASPAETVKKVVKAAEFNDYSVRAVGKKVTIKVNGETTVDQEFDILPAEGVIAFQLHAGGPMTVTFKDIKFTDLSKKK